MCLGTKVNCVCVCVFCVSRDGAVRAGGPIADSVLRAAQGVAGVAGESLEASTASVQVRHPGVLQQRPQLRAGRRPLGVVPVPH